MAHLSALSTLDIGRRIDRRMEAIKLLLCTNLLKAYSESAKIIFAYLWRQHNVKEFVHWRR